jgi:hypothetical protein
MESAEIISPPICLARAMAKAVLPVAVGPANRRGRGGGGERGGGEKDMGRGSRLPFFHFSLNFIVHSADGINIVVSIRPGSKVLILFRIPNEGVLSVSLNILVVDDSMLIRQVVKKVVRQAGLDVGTFIEAANGQEALDILLKTPVDLVLSDINMRGWMELRCSCGCVRSSDSKPCR